MKKTIVLILSLISLTALAPAIPVSAATTTQKLFAACDPSNTNPQAASSPICKDKDTTTNPVNQKLKLAADVVAVVAGLAAVVIIIASGLSLITSSGNSEAVDNARKRITSAIVGLVIIALAWTIIAFVLDRVV